MDTGNRNKLSTAELMRKLLNTASIGGFMHRNEKDMSPPDLGAMLNQLAKERNMEPREAVRRALIDRVYGYQLFSGRRQPSRDKAIMLAIALGLSMDETQRLLRAAGRSELYARVKRDAAILFALNKHLNMEKTQALLEELSLPLLGGSKSDADAAGT